jgi:DNA-3-methyladenine glycosylase
VDGRERLGRGFFARPTLRVARDLIGRRLVRVDRGRRLSGRIVEVEAYVGEDDTACHASRGLTARTRVMFGAPGHAYVYFTYGMHHMLNFVTERHGFPAAVLIRAIEPVEGADLMRRRRRRRNRPAPGMDRPRWIAGGPARLCEALGIDLALNGEDLTAGTRLFVEAGEPVGRKRLLRTPRIGIDSASERDRGLRWRILLAGSPSISR